MTPTKQHHLHVLLFLLICSYSIHVAAKHNTAVPCHPDQASSLLRLKQSFINVDASLASWRAGSDCCHWEGVACDVSSGRVVSLDLGGYNLLSRRLDPAIFNLTSLRNLSLAYNDFGAANLPSYGFERLTNIIHLNFSSTNFFGQIPGGIARLKNLVTLDFSGNYDLYLKEPNFHTFLANLSYLRELRLDEVDISTSGSTWSIVLADSAPQLQILSLIVCGISGRIHHSFSRLRLLTTVDLRGNEGLTGKVPDFFAEFSSLRTLDISGCSFRGQFPTKIILMKSLRVLDLSRSPHISVCLPDFLVGNNLETLNLAGTTLSCDILQSLANLKSLMNLGLSTTGISIELSWINKLQSLNGLQLYGHGFEKPPVFSWIGKLKHLTSLELDGYDFSQSVPSWIGNLITLERLDIQECNFNGPIPYQISYLANLTSLSFDDCNFTGPIFSIIGNLTQLEDLTIMSCNLSGKIPNSLFALPALQLLILSSNQLSGALGDIFVPSSSPLSFIWLSNNQLTGTIPESFFHLKHLEYLYLDSNKLSGTIALSSLWRLKSLDLSNNMLSIVDKEDDNLLSTLPNIKNLGLASCNLTKIPRALRYLDRVTKLDLSNNKINGVIPSWVWESWKDQLQILNLSNNMFTSLERSPSLVHMPSLSVLDLSSNRLQGSIPVLVTLQFPKHKSTGHAPSYSCRSNKLTILDLSYNNFSGPLPSCLIENGNLNILKLRENQFQGMLPEEIIEGCMLQTIDLNGNQIEGKLPRSLSNCQDLELLDVGNNQIVGSFPSWLGALPQLRVLVLRSNQLNGPIWDSKGDHSNVNHFASLQIIDLASNNFSGNLPEEWFSELKAMMANANDQGQVLGHQAGMRSRFYRDTVTVTFKGGYLSFTKILVAFSSIDFSDNSFCGPVPESIGRLVSLHGLNMSYNNFVGQIPSQFSNLSRLESMDLSWNQISGKIPQELASLTSLEWLNLSYNNLSGRIPQGNQFLTFSNSSFQGNAGLRGFPLTAECASQGSYVVAPPESNGLWQDKLGIILLFAFAGLGFGVGFALSCMLQLFCHPEG